MIKREHLVRFSVGVVVAAVALLAYSSLARPSVPELYQYAQVRLKGLDEASIRKARDSLSDAFMLLLNENKCDFGHGNILDFTKGYVVQTVNNVFQCAIGNLDLTGCGPERPRDLEKARALRYAQMAVFAEAFQNFLKRVPPRGLEIAQFFHKSGMDGRMLDQEVCDFFLGLLESPHWTKPLAPILQRYVEESLIRAGRSDRFYKVAHPIEDSFYGNAVMSLKWMKDAGVKARKGPLVSRPVSFSAEKLLWSYFDSGDAQRFIEQLDVILSHGFDVEFLDEIIRKIATSSASWAPESFVTQILAYLDGWFEKHPEITYAECLACAKFSPSGAICTTFEEMTELFLKGKMNADAFRDRCFWLLPRRARITPFLKTYIRLYPEAEKVFWNIVLSAAQAGRNPKARG